MTLYREDEAIDDAIELSKMIGLEEIISRLPKGLDTYISGAALNNLPEGVKQKIIIVSSLIGYPQIILFDDANANFDIKNDTRLVEIINWLQTQGHTIIIVSHRPSFLRMCDKLLVLQEGKLNPKTQSSGKKGRSMSNALVN